MQRREAAKRKKAAWRAGLSFAASLVLLVGGVLSAAGFFLLAAIPVLIIGAGLLWTVLTYLAEQGKKRLPALLCAVVAVAVAVVVRVLLM